MPTGRFKAPPVFHLVQDEHSEATVKVLGELFEEAQRDEILGMVYAVMYRRREYVASAAGECRRNPTFARGMLASLDDVLAEMAREHDGL